MSIFVFEKIFCLFWLQYILSIYYKSFGHMQQANYRFRYAFFFCSRVHTSKTRNVGADNQAGYDARIIDSTYVAVAPGLPGLCWP